MRKVLKSVGILVMVLGIFLGIPQMMVSAAENVIDEEYGYITWSIRDGGCLYIEGTGDFSDKKVDTRAPWREYNYCITSAKVNVKGMTNASWMFEGLYCLEKVDLIEFDTSNVTNMEGMFNRCTDLVEIRFVDLDTSNVTNMKNMFKYCIGLKKLDLRSWDTGNVTNMSGMFSGCTEL